MFQGSFQWVSGVFERSSKGIPGKGQICFKSVSRKFKGCSKKDLRVLQGNFKSVSKMFKINSVGVCAKFQRCFKDVSKKF